MTLLLVTYVILAVVSLISLAFGKRILAYLWNTLLMLVLTINLINFGEGAGFKRTLIIIAAVIYAVAWLISSRSYRLGALYSRDEPKTSSAPAEPVFEESPRQTESGYDYEAEMRKIADDRKETKKLELQREIRRRKGELTALRNNNEGLDKALKEGYLGVDPKANRRKYNNNLEKIRALEAEIRELEAKLAAL